MTRLTQAIIFGILLGISNSGFALEAKAIIQDSSAPAKSYGEVVLTDSAEGLKVNANLSGVPNPGKHGFHIHEFGSCQDSGKGAGSHFNPMQVQHGNLSHDGAEHAHMGDMGNIEIDADGSGSVSIILRDMYLIDGEFNVAGRAVILHEKEDDFTQPAGNAGSRIGCGAIVISGLEQP